LRRLEINERPGDARPFRIPSSVGSPRGNASVSAAIAAHLATLLKQRGLAVAVERIHGCLHEDPELRRLAAASRKADVVALATPLYVDGLPGPVTRALEVLARQRAAPDSPRSRFLAVVNSGFPEAVHNDTGVAICRQFAEEVGLDWIGGLAIGGGGMLAGRPLADQGGRARNVTRALALTADAIAQGIAVPARAQQLTRALPIPAWLYRFIADWGFRREGRSRGTLSRMDDRPHVS
jgi:hypothetical protein